MPSNWASFINEANRNFGVGMKRYEQYSELRDKRLDRADAAAAFEAQKAATADQAVQTQEGFTAGFQPIDRSGWQSGPAITRTAVPTGEAATPSTGGAVTLPEGSAPLPTGSAPHLGAMHGVGGDPKATPSEMVDEALSPLTPPKAADGPEPPLRGKPVGGSERDAGEKKASSKKALEETIDWVVPRANKRAVSNATTEFVQGGTRQEHWDKMRDKLAAIAVRSGDYEALMGLDEKITKMQQSKLQEHLTEAARLMGMGDKEGAANAMYQAYSYYPDGTDVEMRLDDSGRLIAYGYDEASGKFEGGQEMTADKIIGLLEHVKDPVAFSNNMRERRLAQAQTAEEARRWGLEHGIKQEELWVKKQEMLIERGLASTKSQLNRAKTGKYLAESISELAGTTGGSLGWGADGGDHMKYIADHQAFITKVLTDNNYPKGSIEQVLYNPDGPIGAGKLQALGNSISANTPAAAPLGTAEQKQIVDKLGAWELKNSQFGGMDVEDDRLIVDKLKTDNVIFNHYPSSNNPNMVEAIVDGRRVVFNATTWPGVLNYVKNKAPQAGGADTGGADTGGADTGGAVDLTALNQGRETPTQRVGSAIAAYEERGKPQQLSENAKFYTQRFNAGHPFSESDLPKLLEIANDPEASKHLPPEVVKKLLQK